ncbi:MAG: hypothetical protein ACRERX_23010 [Pseudomonas sp.]
MKTTDKYFRQQGGFTMVELLVGATIVSAAAVSFNAGFKAWDQRQVAKSFGESLQPVVNAAFDFGRLNWQQLQKDTPVVAGFTNPRAPTIAELQAANVLPNYVDGQNRIGANARVVLSRAPAGCAPVNCDVTINVYYDRPWLDDTGRPHIKAVAAAAGYIGGLGGYSTIAAPAVFSNTDGTWSTPNPIGQAGVLSAFGTLNTSGDAAFVRIGDIRNPNLQGALSVQGDVATAGNMAVTGNMTGNGDLSVTGSMTAANGRVRAWNVPTEGGVLTLTGADGQQMHIEQVNGKTRFLNGPWNSELAAIDQSGNLNTLGAIKAAQNVDVYGSVNARGGRVAIAPTAWEGWGCSESNGTVTANPNGVILSCQSGVWKNAANPSTAWYTHAAWYVDGTGWVYNDSGKTQFVQASTDDAYRDCAIQGYTNIWGMVTATATRVPYNEQCATGFMVPPNTWWLVNAQRYGGSANFVTWVYTM